MTYLMELAQHLPGGTDEKPRGSQNIRLPGPEHEQVLWFHA